MLTDSGSEGAQLEYFYSKLDFIAPELILPETANIIRRLERTGKITQFEAVYAHNDLLNVDIELYPYKPFAERVWQLRFNLTTYDAWYVAIAETLGCKLITLDLKLTRLKNIDCEVVIPRID